MNREAFLSLHFLKSEEFPGRYYVTCWRSQSYCKPGNSTSETHMVTTIPSFLRDCIKRHFLVIRDSLTNRLITHECVCLVGPVWLGRALGHCFQLEVCEPFCLWILCSQTQPFGGRKPIFSPCFCSWGDVVGGNKQQQELWCVFTTLFVDIGVRHRHFLCFASYLLAALKQQTKVHLFTPLSLGTDKSGHRLECPQPSDFQSWLQKTQP